MKDLFFNKIFIGVNLSLFFVFTLSFFFPEHFFSVLSWIKNVFVLKTSWMYAFVIFIVTLFSFYLVLSPYRNFRLGGQQEKPEYNLFTWLAMLFSAGMGTGIMFSGVYEPFYHYIYPTEGTGSRPEALDFSFLLTFIHWGFAGWALYIVVGFSLAYFFFFKKLPLRFSSAFRPLFKKKMEGSLGYALDILVVLCTLFGVATTLGRGALQMNAGLSEFFGISYSGLTQSLIIVAVTFFATVSVLSGLSKGIRRLSEVNILLCFALLIFVFCLGPSLFLLQTFLKSTGVYLYHLINFKNWFRTFGDAEWRSQWTTLYWAWWMAWTPFVGIFIARISRGRTLKEFVLGALLIPTLLSFIWFVVFGGTAIFQYTQGTMDLTPFLKEGYALIVFKFLSYFPLYPWIAYLALFSVVIFFITSSDSASYMISRMVSLKDKPPLSQKIYWSFLEGFIALFFLLIGGMQALEQIVILTSLPFALLLLLLIYSLIKSLRQDFS